MSVVGPSVGTMHQTTRVYCTTCRHVRTFRLTDPRTPQGLPELVCLRCGGREMAPPVRV
jgi:hypothetical protein